MGEGISFSSVCFGSSLHLNQIALEINFKIDYNPSETTSIFIDLLMG